MEYGGQEKSSLAAPDPLPKINGQGLPCKPTSTRGVGKRGRDRGTKKCICTLQWLVSLSGGRAAKGTPGSDDTQSTILFGAHGSKHVCGCMHSETLCLSLYRRSQGGPSATASSGKVANHLGNIYLVEHMARATLNLRGYGNGCIDVRAKTMTGGASHTNNS
jgi:hypothetical protein